MNSVREQLIEQGISLRSYTTGGHKIPCSKCSHTRKNKTDPCLSVTIEANGAVWKCHHCQWDGGVTEREKRERIEPRRHREIAPVQHKIAPPTDQAVAYLVEKRKIPRVVLERNGVGTEHVWMPGCESGQTVTALAFPYRLKGDVVNVKYRTHDKRFRQVKDATKAYYGMDDCEGVDWLVICEGEIDKLSFEAAGILNVVSVPDGAPAQIKTDMPDPEEDRKFEYVWTCEEFFRDKKKIILATDNDPPGMALAEELARRYGKARCWRVQWPDAGDVACKDANEVLVQHGPKTLQEMIEAAKPYPIKEFSGPSDFEDQIWALYHNRVRQPVASGWSAIDEHWRISTSQMAIVTGHTNHGKSQFCDALMVNLAELHDWKFGLCSFENPREDHFTKLAEIHERAPFYDGPRVRMSENDVRRSMRWAEKHFVWITPEHDSPTIDWVLEHAAMAVLRYGIKGLIIDPYNDLDNTRERHQSETEYVNELLKKVRKFSRDHDMLVIFAAHPAKPTRLKDGSYPVPSLYDISGSAHWGNKADIGIVVWRDYEGEDLRPPKFSTDIHIKKVRFKRYGRAGVVRLDYDRVTGRYTVPMHKVKVA